MTNLNESATGQLEWSIRLPEASSQNLVSETSPAVRFLLFIKCLMVRILEKVWNMGTDDHRKVIHCIKVGISLSVVSLFYYIRPLYDGVGGNAMWAVMTVVVVFEYTVGATLYKCLNRAIATSLAGILAVGIHWIASRSGEKFEPIVTGVAVFVLASATTFSRFIPSVKARFDYGATIFILTFCLVSVSGYRVEKLFDMAHERLSTIIIGTCLCILISMFLFPVWAGTELHLLITRNLEKLADSLDCCVAEKSTKNIQEHAKELLLYKCVLNSKALEESMANYARWEPAHGGFNFQHPWKQYHKIGALTRNCAYCIEALNSCINSEKQALVIIDEHLSYTCQKVSSSSSRILKELATSINTMTRSSKLDIWLDEMNCSIQELQNYMKSLSGLIHEPEAKSFENEKKEAVVLTINDVDVLEIMPLITFASLLIEIAGRVEQVVDAVEELANLAEFKDAAVDKTKQNQLNRSVPCYEENLKTLEKV